MIQVKHDDSLVFNKRNQLFPDMQIYKNNGAGHHYPLNAFFTLGRTRKQKPEMK